MTGTELKKLREKLGLTREEFAETFGLASHRVVMNIELDYRRPSKLTMILLRAIDSLPKPKAQALIALLRKHTDV